MLPPGSRIADVGSAPGHITLSLKQLGFEVTAFDFLPEKDLWESSASGFAAMLREHAIPIEQWDVEVVDPKQVDEPAALGAFDGVVFTEILEHIYRYPFASVRQVAKLLRPGGLMVITTPNRGYLTFRLQALAGKPLDVDLDMLRDDFLPHMRHVHLWDLNELCTLASDCGMDPVVSEVRSFHLHTTTPKDRTRSGLTVAIRRSLKALLGVFLSVFPNLGSSLCVVARKR